MSGFNLADVYESLAAAFPDRLAVACGEATLTFGQLDARATRLAWSLQRLGVGEGAHIGLYLYNGHEYLEAMLAAWKLRARTINLNFRYTSAELAYVLDDAGIQVLLYEADLAAQVDGAGFEGLRVVRGPDYEALLVSAEGGAFGPRSEDDLFILYTGGTTGRPKGVMWRHVDLFFAALQGGQPGGEPFRRPEDMAPALQEYGDGIHILTAAPLIHGSSQLACWIALMNGGLAVLVPGRSYDPAACLEACQRWGVHTLNVVGDAMALPLVDALEASPGRWDLSTLSVVSSAGAILSGHVRRRLEELLAGAMVLNSFGSSETGHQGSAFYEDDRPMWVMDPEHTLVVDDELRPVEPGQVGRIARFGHVPLGYYRDTEKTAATFFERDGRRYVVPGDLATVGDDGTITFLGRGSMCINTGGEKVFAEEVEEALKHHPAVYDAVVVGVPDARWGERVEALLTLRAAAGPVDVTEIARELRARIAGYKVPQRLWVVEDLHRQPSGKPDYRWARAEAARLGRGV